MADEKIADHTIGLLREIRADQQRHGEMLRRIQTDVAALKQTDGAILSMLGGFDEGANATRREVDELRQRITRLETEALGSD